jgi:hypothetical protein
MLVLNLCVEAYNNQIQKAGAEVGLYAQIHARF